MADYQRQNKADLQADANRRGLDVGEDPTKQDLVNALSEHDRQRADHSGSDTSQGNAQGGTDAGQGPPAVQVGQGDDGERAREALAAQAHGDVPVSSVTGQDVADVTSVTADDDRVNDQVGAAEGLQLAEAGNARVQDRVNAENEVGFRGLNPDPTPNLAYTSEGRALGLPTPETDPDAYESAQRALRAGGGRFAGTEAAQQRADRVREHQQQVAQASRDRNDQARQDAQ